MKKEEALQLMLNKARTAQDPTNAECWIITAKTLGASYDVDLVGYQIQCDKKNAAAAAETLQQMYLEFSHEPRFWEEVTKLIESVKRDSAEESMIFYKSVFQHLLPAMQQTLLLEMAEKQKDKVEQCRYLLLLFRLFPESVGQFGEQLITVLSDLEKSLPNVYPHENIYSQLLVYEITPILLKSKELNLEENKCIQLLRQALQFYVSLAASGPPMKKHSITVTKTPRTPKSLESKDSLLDMEVDNRPNDPWDSLLQCCLLVAQTCNWEVAKKLKNFKTETMKSVMKNAMDLNIKSNETFYTSLLVFIFLAYKHASSGTSMPNVHSVVVVVPPEPKEQNFIPAESSSPSNAKRIKLSSASSVADGVLSSNNVVTETYAVSAQCSQMVKSNSALINSLLPSDKYPWISQFFRDSLLCSGNYKEILNELDTTPTDDRADISKLLQLTSCKLLTQNYDESLRFAINLIKKSSSTADKPAQFASADWHYAALHFTQVTYYACKVILHCLLDGFNEEASDVVIGHLLVLSQVDYPKFSWLSRSLLAIISKKQKFFFPKLLNYITVPTVLEEIAYLNAYENNLVLEIVETDTTRKTGHSTRHSTRGAKGDIRAFLENQMTAGCRQSVEEVLKRYVIENEELLFNFNASLTSTPTC